MEAQAKKKTSRRKVPPQNRQLTESEDLPAGEQTTRSHELTFYLKRNETFVKPTQTDSQPTEDMLRAEDVKEEFLVCSICTREFDEESHVPRVLPCLHTFCQVCLKKIVSGPSLSCPLCKTDHLLPKNSIQGFAKDTTRRNLIDFIKVRKRSSEILCKDCPEDQTATDFCKDCYIFMCSDCTKAHRRSLASRKHGVSTINELQTSGIDVFRRKLECTKQGHEGQQLAFYCTKPGCERAVCTACTVCDHDRSNGHVIINVTDIYRLKKAELDKLFKSLETDISSAKFVLQQTESELLNMDIKELEVEKDIDDAFAMCAEILAKRQARMKEQLAILCEKKKESIQQYVEKIENYLDSAANAKDFSLHVLKHTDPTEFVPLHTTLLERLKTMSDVKINRQVLNIESPLIDTKKMESDFHGYCKDLGEISTVSQQKRLSITRGHTHIGLSSASTVRQAADDHRFGDVTCPAFTLDAETVHQYREVSENTRIIRNFSTVHKHPPGTAIGRRLKKYRGVIGTRAFQIPGRSYFEVFISYNIMKALDNINFVFEIGVCRRGDIDCGYYVYDQLHAWSFCGQHCDEHKQVCMWCRHHGRNLSHCPLTPSTSGTLLERTFGFLLDADKGQFSVIDVSRRRRLFTFQGVDVSAGLWPVFGCHWPSKVKLEMKIRTGREIESIPACIKDT